MIRPGFTIRLCHSAGKAGKADPSPINSNWLFRHDRVVEGWGMPAKLKGAHFGYPLTLHRLGADSHAVRPHGCQTLQRSSRHSYGRRAHSAKLTRCNASDRLSFYSVLGVTEDATLAEIKSAFRRLARRWHPDHNTGPAAKTKYQVSQLSLPLCEPQLCFACQSSCMCVLC